MEWMKTIEMIDPRTYRRTVLRLRRALARPGFAVHVEDGTVDGARVFYRATADGACTLMASKQRMLGRAGNVTTRYAYGTI